MWYVALLKLAWEEVVDTGQFFGLVSGLELYSRSHICKLLGLLLYGILKVETASMLAKEFFKELKISYISGLNEVRKLSSAPKITIAP